MANSRRTFLKQAAGVTAAHFFGVPTLSGAETKSVVGNPGWYNRPMRWAQLAFVEDDPGNYDRLLARLLSQRPCRCGLPERRWQSLRSTPRKFLCSSAAHGWAIAIPSGLDGRLPRHGHERDCAHRFACLLAEGLRCAS